MSEREFLQRKIIALTQTNEDLSDVAFSELALSVFRFQFQHNAPYRRYCERRSITPDTAQHWLDVPAVPTAAFKEAKLMAGDPADAELVFRTSGTTQGVAKRGVHYVLDRSIYEASLLPTFKRFVLPDVDMMTMVSLVPEWRKGGESSLAYMISFVMQKLGSVNSFNAVSNEGVDFDRLTERLQQTDEPVCILGTSLAFVHWFEHLRAQQISLVLPNGSRVMDTGGFKGVQRAISSKDLRELYRELLGVTSTKVVNEYGMTEMLSQFYDLQLRDPAYAGIKGGPPWVRSAVVHPESLKPLPEGETGLLRHFDLANVFSVSAIQTEDVGIQTRDGFELLGRASGATPRGCSIAMDMFLSAART